MWNSLFSRIATSVSSAARPSGRSCPTGAAAPRASVARISSAFWRISSLSCWCCSRICWRRSRWPSSAGHRCALAPSCVRPCSFISLERRCARRCSRSARPWKIGQRVVLLARARRACRGACGGRRGDRRAPSSGVPRSARSGGPFAHPPPNRMSDLCRCWRRLPGSSQVGLAGIGHVADDAVRIVGGDHDGLSWRWKGRDGTLACLRQPIRARRARPGRLRGRGGGPLGGLQGHGVDPMPIETRG